jgi:hypothetical protein
MTEYIKREDALRAVKHAWAKGIEPSEYIEGIEAADVAPVRHGQWLTTDAYPHRLYCSLCFTMALPNVEYRERWGVNFTYCPSCGAKMDGGTENG